jgi:hypothetical protein
MWRTLLWGDTWYTPAGTPLGCVTPCDLAASSGAGMSERTKLEVLFFLERVMEPVSALIWMI